MGKIYYLNTSNVNVNQIITSRIKFSHCYLNTSNVNVNRFMLRKKNILVIYLNTSNVNVNPINSLIIFRGD